MEQGGGCCIPFLANLSAHFSRPNWRCNGLEMAFGSLRTAAANARAFCEDEFHFIKHKFHCVRLK